MNKLNVEYWEDFSTTKTSEVLEEGGIVSYQSTIPDNTIWDTFSYTAFPATSGVHIMDDTLAAKNRRTRCMAGHLGEQSDYLQFALKNDSEKDMIYTLSFMLYFAKIAIDTNDYLLAESDYVLPLKLIALDEEDNETLLKDSIEIPYACAPVGLYNQEYYEISDTVNVPAGKEIRLQLKLNGELPKCQVPDQHSGAENEFHPVVYYVDNIAVSSGSSNTISLGVNETYQLQLDTLETDTVEYYTNCYLAQYTHNAIDTDCTRFDTITASVDESGLITANAPGETGLIAVITHEDGTVERKQCIVQVTE